MPKPLNPLDVLADLFEEDLINDPMGLAAIVIHRLEDAGFEVRPARPISVYLRRTRDGGWKGQD